MHRRSEHLGIDHCPPALFAGDGVQRHDLTIKRAQQNLIRAHSGAGDKTVFGVLRPQGRTGARVEGPYAPFGISRENPRVHNERRKCSKLACGAGTDTLAPDPLELQFSALNSCKFRRLVHHLVARTGGQACQQGQNQDRTHHEACSSCAGPPSSASLRSTAARVGAFTSMAASASA